MQETVIIDIIQDKAPLPLLFVAQPVMNKLLDIGPRILSARDLDFNSNLPDSFARGGLHYSRTPRRPMFQSNWSLIWYAYLMASCDFLHRV
jgi:hypothetical protein